MSPSIHWFAHLILWFAVASLILHWRTERLAMRRAARQLEPSVDDPLVTALHLGGIIFSRVPRGHDPIYLFSFLAPVGASPIAVLRQGGCCSGLARLYILTLDALGIPAAQVTLYHRSGRAQHCLVELIARNERLIVDPQYGFYFRDAGGAPIGLEDLRAGALPSFVALPFSVATAYPSHRYYDFEFRNTKTANWTKSLLRRGVYRALRLASRGSVDCWRVPPSLEWPQLILVSGLLLSIMLYDTLLLAFEMF